MRYASAAVVLFLSYELLFEVTRKAKRQGKILVSVKGSASNPPVNEEVTVSSENEERAVMVPSHQQEGALSEVYIFFRDENGQFNTSCYRILSPNSARAETDRYCNSFRTNVQLLLMCRRQRQYLLAALPESGADSFSLSDIMKRLRPQLHHVLFQGRSAMNLEYLERVIEGCFTRPSVLVTESCQFWLASKLLVSQEGDRFEPGNQDLQLDWARSCLLQVLPPPGMDAMLIGLIARIIETGTCRRHHITTLQPPKRMNRREFIYTTAAFVLASWFVPPGLVCTLTQAHPTCLALKSYTILSRAFLSLANDLPRIRPHQRRQSLENLVDAEQRRLTDDDLQVSSFIFHTSLVETIIMSLVARGRLVRAGLWFAKSTKVSRLLAMAARFFVPWLDGLVSGSGAPSSEQIFPGTSLEKAYARWASSSGRCTTGSKGLQNIIEQSSLRVSRNVARRNVSTTPEAGTSSSFLSTKIPMLINERHIILSQSFLQYDTGEVRAESSEHWNRKRRFFFAMIIIGAILTNFFLGAAFVSFINPIFFVFLGLGLIGFVIFVSFVIVLTKQHVVLRAARQAQEST